ncbi:MAG: hypothetical protein OEV08_07825 [Nitrospira sp.]|nr:hypothetical protein [Nitrospira sp.]
MIYVTRAYSLRLRDRLQRGLSHYLVALVCVGVLAVTIGGGASAEESQGSADATTIIDPASVATDQVTVDPFIHLRGLVWRTKPGIVFLRTPIGLLTLSSKTTLKDLKASQEVLFWVHEQHMVVEIRKRADGSLVHRYLSGPMTSGTEEPKTLHWWGPNGDEIVHVEGEDKRFSASREGDVMTVEVDEENGLRGVHDLQFDLQVSQAPAADADVQLFLSGTVSKLKSNFVLLRTPIGLVMLNTKIGIPSVKVGQSLSVHIDDGQVIVTLQPVEALSPRQSQSSPR